MPDMHLGRRLQTYSARLLPYGTGQKAPNRLIFKKFTEQDIWRLEIDKDFPCVRVAGGGRLTNNKGKEVETGVGTKKQQCKVCILDCETFIGVELWYAAAGSAKGIHPAESVNASLMGDIQSEDDLI